ncbi:acetaldehyde dehydrogenase (acetylating) [Rossellomorea aquimaris]|uniref:acetaldehyde dehydrogenase (acetylating) n=1 Tax=Rossellomorea aquimaris TaxID=189382 RepID=UPI0011E93F4A|nr:acetaldehyde dehydrogenase (acetylating) [Rossellomorea aquimaris]TYS90743.1 acetaldehyde dehydrogenase (acetylating) [Rossellomorea aquimaris]
MKTKVAIIGSGNIGTDLMKKLLRSDVLELTAMIGIDSNSEGLRMAKEHGLSTFSNGLDGFLEKYELADVLFDATSAKAHHHHAEILKKLGKKVIDLTPAAIGPFVVPPVNLHEHLHEQNVNMITCGGQATIPIVHSINSVAEVEYAEIVATISSRSAGPGTRANIDEFTVTTAKGLEVIGGAENGKAIIILNPAEPPILMRDTVYCLLKGNVIQKEITQSIKNMVKRVSEYVPGYRLRTDPIFEDNKVTVFLEVEGSGDYLPSYAGNLDIMTSSAVKVGEELAKYVMTQQA